MSKDKTTTGAGGRVLFHRLDADEAGQCALGRRGYALSIVLTPARARQDLVADRRFEQGRGGAPEGLVEAFSRCP